MAGEVDMRYVMTLLNSKLNEDASTDNEFHLDKYISIEREEEEENVAGEEEAESVCGFIRKNLFFETDRRSEVTIPQYWLERLGDFCNEEVTDVFPFDLRMELESRPEYQINIDQGVDLQLMRVIQLLQCVMHNKKRELQLKWFHCMAIPSFEGREEEVMMTFYKTNINMSVINSIAGEMLSNDLNPTQSRLIPTALFTVKRCRARIAFDCSFEKRLMVCMLSPSYIRKLRDYILALQNSVGITPDSFFPIGDSIINTWEEIVFYDPNIEWRCIPQRGVDMLLEITEMLKITGLNSQITRFSSSNKSLIDFLNPSLVDLFPNLSIKHRLRQPKSSTSFKRLRKQ